MTEPMKTPSKRNASSDTPKSFILSAICHMNKGCLCSQMWLQHHILAS